MNESPLIRTLYITSAVYLALHLAAFWIPGKAWGFDALVYSDVGAILFVLLVLLIAALQFFDTVKTRISRLLADDHGYVDWILFALYAITLLLFESQTHLLGDGRLLIRELSVGAESPTERAPLSLFLIRSLFDVLGDAELSYTTTSVGAGLTFYWVSVGIARLLSDDRVTQRLSALLLLSQGYILLFFGYPETYSLLVVSNALYAFTVVAYLRSRTPILAPSVCLAFTICIHLASVALLPSLLVATFVRDRNRRVDLAWTLSAPALAVISLYLLDYDFFSGGGSLIGKHLLPLGSPLPYTAAYLLQSPAHLIDVANALLLSAPACLCGLTLFRGRWEKTDLVYLSMAGPAVLLILAINSEIGAFRDWDILAFPALFLSLWMIHRVRSLSADVQIRVFGILVGASILHSVPWVAVNANATASVNRFETLLEHAANSERGTQYGWDSLAGFLRDAGKEEAAYEAYERAVALFPDHPRMLRAAAHAAGRLGRYDRAVAHFESAMLLLSGQDTLISNYGRALLKVGRNEEASTQFRSALSISPGQPDVVRLLAQAEFRSGNLDSALNISNRVIDTYGPGIREDYVMIGSIYGRRGQPQLAVEALQHAVRLSPDDVDARKRLGAAYRMAQNPDSALIVLSAIPEDRRPADVWQAIGGASYAKAEFGASVDSYQRALKLDPNSADLHYRLGSAYLASGRTDESLVPLQEAIRLDPRTVGAYRNLGVAYSELNRYEDAKSVFEALLNIAPNVADRDELTQWIQDH